MNALTVGKIQQAYEKDGYYFPLQALSKTEADDYQRRLKALSESEHASRLGLNRSQLNSLHVVCRHWGR